MYFNSVSFKNRNLLIKLESETGTPIEIILFSFVKGYSKNDDEDTYVPVSFFVELLSDTQEIRLDPSKQSIPDWWYEEFKAPKNIAFSLEDVRILEFEVLVDKEIGPVSDTIKINSILLQ